jgi:hypothetical protein
MYPITNGFTTTSKAISHPPRTCAQLTNFGGAIMRKRMQRHLRSRPGHGFQKPKMCNVRILRSKITFMASRFETEI